MVLMNRSFHHMPDNFQAPMKPINRYISTPNLSPQKVPKTRTHNPLMDSNPPPPIHGIPRSGCPPLTHGLCPGNCLNSNTVRRNASYLCIAVPQSYTPVICGVNQSGVAQTAITKRLSNIMNLSLKPSLVT